MPRRAWFLGRWIMHGGWYPDQQLRLFKRGVTRFTDSEIHERIADTSATGYLRDGVLDHYSYRDIADYVARLNRYTTLEAQTRYKTESSNILKLFVKPFYRFIRQYIIGLGFLDGFPGLLVAILSSWYVVVVHIKIYEYRRRKK